MVWSDPWLQDGTIRIPLMKNIMIDLNLKLHDLVDPSSGTWDRPTLEDQFFPRDISLILALNSIPNLSDYWVWKYTRLGEYNVKSENWLANQDKFKQLVHQEAALPSINGLKQEIWNSQAPNKIQIIFLWRSISGAIPVIDKILTKRVKVDTRCQVCGLKDESINHVLFFCSATRQIWVLTEFFGQRMGSVLNLFTQTWPISLHCIYPFSEKKIEIPLQTRRIVPWILWFIWKIKNYLFYESRKFWQQDTLKKIREESLNWFLAQFLL